MVARLYKTGLLMHLFVLVSCIMAVGVAAQGNFLLQPQRIIFEGGSKAQELNLVNTGKDTAQYTISLMEIRMKEEGGFQQITRPDSGQNFASGHLRFTPQSLTLGPHESGKIKVEVLQPKALAPGEYRSHICFKALPRKKPMNENTEKDMEGTSVLLTPLLGMVFPVIILVGSPSATVTLSGLLLESTKDNRYLLHIKFNRTGNRSVYGDVAVHYLSEQGIRTQAGLIKGIAVYAPTGSRLFRMPLNPFPAFDYHSGKLQVVYTSCDDKPVVLAEATLELKE
jgi:hypothetical protein